MDNLYFAFAFALGLGSLVPWWSNVGLPRTLQVGMSRFLGIHIRNLKPLFMLCMWTETGRRATTVSLKSHKDPGLQI